MFVPVLVYYFILIPIVFRVKASRRSEFHDFSGVVVSGSTMY